MGKTDVVFLKELFSCSKTEHRRKVLAYRDGKAGAIWNKTTVAGRRRAKRIPILSSISAWHLAIHFEKTTLISTWITAKERNYFHNQKRRKSFLSVEASISLLLILY